MTTTTMFTLFIHDNGADIEVYADAFGEQAMAVTIRDRGADVDLRISANDTADLHNTLMRCLTAVASEAARARPDEPEPAEDRTLPPCDTCHSEPVCVIDGSLRQCSGCYLAAQEVPA